MTRPRRRTRPLPDHAPTAAEAERDLAVDRGEVDPYEWPRGTNNHTDPWELLLPTKGEN